MRILILLIFQDNRNENKNKQMGPNQTYKLLHSKINRKQNEKTVYRMGEGISKQCDWQGINLQNIQTVYTTQQQKTIQQKNGQTA